MRLDEDQNILRKTTEKITRDFFILKTVFQNAVTETKSISVTLKFAADLKWFIYSKFRSIRGNYCYISLILSYCTAITLCQYLMNTKFDQTVK